MVWGSRESSGGGANFLPRFVSARAMAEWSTGRLASWWNTLRFRIIVYTRLELPGKETSTEHYRNMKTWKVSDWLPENETSTEHYRNKKTWKVCDWLCDERKRLGKFQLVLKWLKIICFSPSLSLSLPLSLPLSLCNSHNSNQSPKELCTKKIRSKKHSLTKSTSANTYKHFDCYSTILLKICVKVKRQAQYSWQLSMRKCNKKSIWLLNWSCFDISTDSSMWLLGLKK